MGYSATTAPLTGTPEQLLGWALQEFGNSFAITTSFQKSGMVLIDMASRIAPAVRVVTLDTGRLPEATYEMIQAVRERYGIAVETVSPDQSELEEMVRRFGPNLFRNEVPLRRLCCEIRKVRPLNRKLQELRAWATGLRRDQAESRSSIEPIEETGGRFKLNPLAGWSSREVEEYTTRFDLPRHPLYAMGYTSIGCAPCTRAVRDGEHERAGRWWWEEDDHKECGVHFSSNGKVERTVDVLVREIVDSKVYAS